MHKYYMNNGKTITIDPELYLKVHATDPTGKNVIRLLRIRNKVDSPITRKIVIKEFGKPELHHILFIDHICSIEFQ